MKSKGSFVFKSFTHRDGGTFKNADGQEIAYKGSYVLKVDEIMDDGEINERKFKVKEDNTVLINDLKTLEAYQKIYLEFNVILYTSSVSLEVCDVDVYVNE